ncbi:PREDICTED: uncharacterized protein LOC104600485 [Nelumbo nucifera]|uniref:Uncharacterized protein LOC104600485 n=2 Tax=Nelumbo nucifera TaxID=4432 RepID=A0A1U8A5M1_NELNU|nr:PREDICTED: uncharacterized protein LOC104600485 [Nelumbo nucifera]DAD44184.1 TPA_asm: hypothetical protein HUJ06_002414 [Nelumbo nucifera]
MDVLGSPLEALLYNYVSAGFLSTIHNLLAWVAILTAAFSVWKVRAAGSHSHPPKLQVVSSLPNLLHGASSELTPSNSDSSKQSSQPSLLVDKPSLASACATTQLSTAICAVADADDNRTNGGKITLSYYEDLDDDESTPTESLDDQGADGNGGVWWEATWGVEEQLQRGGTGSIWVGLGTTNTGDLGWYHYQDLTMLNGSVVRLWDNHRRRSRRQSGS